MAARDDNFLNDGTVDPFAGLAPAEDPSTAEAARRLALRRSATATANINLPSGGVDPSGMPRGQSINPATGQPYTGDERPNGGTFLGSIAPTLKAISKDPVTFGVLAAPYGVLGAGAALGGLSSGGAGTLVGSSTPGMAFADTSTAGAEAAMNAAHVPAGAAAGGAPAAAPTLGSMMGADASKYALPVALGVAPYAINKIMGGRTKEEDALIAKQQQMAQEAKVRQGQQQDARMNQLGQQLLAFNPRNQMMAQMFGPQAAFSPDQMAQMVQGQAPPFDPAVANYTGDDPQKKAQYAEYWRRRKEFEAAEAQRHDMMMNGFQQPGPGPAPMQMSAPQAARKY